MLQGDRLSADYNSSLAAPNAMVINHSILLMTDGLGFAHMLELILERPRRRPKYDTAMQIEPKDRNKSDAGISMGGANSHDSGIIPPSI
jgi:hypothetical protein